MKNFIFCAVIEGGISKSLIRFDDVVNVERIPWAATSFDTVLLIRLNWWPTITTEWKKRKQNCLNNENVINNLTKEVRINIAKPIIGDKCNKQKIELRYSFSHVEWQLVYIRSSHDKMIYLLFKAMIYKWLTPIQPNQIKSFCGETVMFWVCEANYKNDGTFWKEVFKSKLKVLCELFHRMMKYFECYFMPY